MADYDSRALYEAMAERRSRRADAKRHVVASMTADDAVEIGDRMADLVDVLLALQPHEVRLLGDFTEVLWGSDHRDKRLVVANLQSVMEAIA